MINFESEYLRAYFLGRHDMETVLALLTLCEGIHHHYCIPLTKFRTLYHYSKLMLSHCGNVIVSAMESQITSLTIVYTTVYLGADQRKHQSSASLAFVRGIHLVTGEFPAQTPVTRKMFPFDDVIMTILSANGSAAFNEIVSVHLLIRL